MTSIHSELRRLARRAPLRVAVAAASIGLCSRAGAEEGDAVEVLRDEFGVPHVFAGDLVSACFGWGYTAAQDLGDPILAGYLAGDGRSAAVFGRHPSLPGFSNCEAADVISRMWGIPRRVEARWHELKPRTRAVFEAFAAGVERYFQDHPSPWHTEPVTGRAVAKLLLLVRLWQSYTMSTGQLTPAGPMTGSNQFAVTGERTPGDVTFVSSDPHFPWKGFEPFVHVRFDDLDLFGNLAPFPWIDAGGNNYVQYGVSTSIGIHAVVVDSPVRDDGRYHHHEAGWIEPPPPEIINVQVAGEAPTVFTIHRTRYGISQVTSDKAGLWFHAEPGRVRSLMVWIHDDIGLLDVCVDQLTVRSVDEMITLFGRERPTEYANRTFGGWPHRVAYVNGLYAPSLPPSLDWRRPVDSTSLTFAWPRGGATDWFNLDGRGAELPHVVDPACGWVQDSNGHPAWATAGGDIAPSLPAFIGSVNGSTGNTDRGMRLRSLLNADEPLDLSAVQRIAMDIRVVPAEQLIEGARLSYRSYGVDADNGDAGDFLPLLISWGLPLTDARAAAELLRILFDWRSTSYQATKESVAMTVFTLYRERFDPPLPEPDGPPARLTRDQLASSARQLAQLARDMRRRFGDVARFPDPLRVPWGELNYTRVGGRNVPLDGGPDGTLHMTGAVRRPPAEAPRPPVDSGSQWKQLTRFGPERGRIDVYLSVPHGQVDESRFPASPHVGQTIDRFANRAYRRVPLRREEIVLCPHGDRPGHEHRARLTLSRSTTSSRAGGE